MDNPPIFHLELICKKSYGNKNYKPSCKSSQLILNLMISNGKGRAGFSEKNIEDMKKSGWDLTITEV
jgi:hypothetical protein